MSRSNPLERSDRFDRQYQKLPEEIKNKVDKALRFLTADTRYPSLETHEVHGKIGKFGGKLFEGKVDDKYRLTWEYRESNLIFLRNVDNHDECLRNP